ncbi:hypothetical protein EJB05_49983 [Eragrostis curvula]|uniref:Uncharacterized protein n=1 Tax=Eragrostis curvula TaxID=38414 RepID=A0A5J9T0V1_9POAL|nr:hypothetical protein EJB05_49983 [Eragrostis curvula]
MVHAVLAPAWWEELHSAVLLAVGGSTTQTELVVFFNTKWLNSVVGDLSWSARAFSTEVVVGIGRSLQ